MNYEVVISVLVILLVISIGSLIALIVWINHGLNEMRLPVGKYSEIERNIISAVNLYIYWIKSEDGASEKYAYKKSLLKISQDAGRREVIDTIIKEEWLKSSYQEIIKKVLDFLNKV